MGSTNILQWNPGAANQETDSQYAADAQRVFGAASPSIFNAPLANKAFFQWAGVIYSLCTAMANNGFVMDDSNIGLMIANFQQLVTSGTLPPHGLQTVAWATNITFNCAQASSFVCTLLGSTTLTVSNATPGQLITMMFVQNGAGGHTVAFPGNVVAQGTPDPGANEISTQTFFVDGGGILRPISGMTVYP